MKDRIPSVFRHPIFRFMAVGAVTTLLDYIIYYLLSRIMHFVPAKICSMLCSTFFAFLINKNWTFRCRDQGWAVSLGKYYVTQAANIAVNVSVNSVLFFVFRQRLPAFCAATLAGMTVNFLLQKNYVFKNTSKE